MSASVTYRYGLFAGCSVTALSAPMTPAICASSAASCSRSCAAWRRSASAAAADAASGGGAAATPLAASAAAAAAAPGGSGAATGFHRIEFFPRFSMRPTPSSTFVMS